MLAYIIKKISYGILVLWGVLTLVFFLFNVLPGDPARMMLDKREDANQLAVIKQKYAFDRSLGSNMLYTLMMFCHFQFIIIVQLLLPL